ncbi:sterol desaturase family protein [Marinomonas mediterranea]|jgi:Sterol desaturase|uniref:Fatty acid hydroxylase n=1 Tax=Marinomonas mediterranea (strain ATCC 700492 / JCM 21426 / NBRC 103028 / MMB-1) TaxID=717774 RepID=F2K491_MARM1|nr:sterol desaturase family protein [Marinomonas mediterranea]ADZ92532.1 fatty acid hydroxylase [Marinomonas mediterranea MMB-1]WCN10478.1 sterol desaturase family protein [Marinomonas mediterranea]WCN18577.1 sterol desaturase family protein [Marinomonas mediterranea MMB-1]
MTDYTLRVIVFFAVFAALIVWQWRSPRSTLQKWRYRWRHNLLLFSSGVLVVRVAQPTLLSLVAYSYNEGLLTYIDLPSTISVFVGIVLLDVAIYWQHRVFHTVPLLWRLHRVHHTDPELDISSAVRFHPLEILLSLCIKSAVIVVLGIPALSVLLFDILLNAASLFNHTNARLPKKIEKIVRLIIVTPDHHRIHHSRDINEANSNYAFFLSIWDKIFDSYTHSAKQGDLQIAIGLPQTKQYEPKGILSLFTMPFWTHSRTTKEVKGD